MALAAAARPPLAPPNSLPSPHRSRRPEQVGTARLLRDSFPGQHERVMLKLDATPELQFLYLQGVLQQAQRYATPVAAGSDRLPFAEQIQQVLHSALRSGLRSALRSALHSALH